MTETRKDAAPRHTAPIALSFEPETPIPLSPNAVALRAMALTAQSLEYDPQLATRRTEDILRSKAKVAKVCRAIFNDTQIRRSAGQRTRVDQDM